MILPPAPQRPAREPVCILEPARPYYGGERFRAAHERREARRQREACGVVQVRAKGHVRAANPEFNPRTYGCAKLVDLIEKTGQFQVKRNEVPVRARMKRLQ